MMQLNPQTLEAYKLMHDGILAFARAELTGIRVDTEYCRREDKRITAKVNRLERQAENTQLVQDWRNRFGARFNLNSDDQLATILYKEYNLEPPKKTKGGKRGATDYEALSGLDVPGLPVLIEIRKLTKVRDTYLRAFMREQVDGVVRTSLNLHIPRSYRSSSSNPNFQNNPKREKELMEMVRRAIYPRWGHLFLAEDYSGIEVRMACIYTKDPKLVYDTLHGDMHRDMAMEIFMLSKINKKHRGEKEMRQAAKNGFVFPQFYGDYYKNNVPILLKYAKANELEDGTPVLVHLADKGLLVLNADGSIADAQRFYDHVQAVEYSFWNDRYKVYTEWKDEWWAAYQKNGYLDMLTGFRCSGEMGRNAALNYPFQGTAFHCLLWSFIETSKRSRKEHWDSVPVLQIHDEILTDVHPQELEHVANTIRTITCEELPQAWPWIDIPLEVEADVTEIDGCWANKSEYKLH